MILASVSWGAILIGIGAVLSGTGALLTGLAALRAQRAKAEEEVIVEPAE